MKTSTVFFNATPYLDVDDNCTLYLNGSLITVWVPNQLSGIVPSGMSLTYTEPISLADGNYNWQVACFQDGTENDSAVFGFIINTAAPTLILTPTTVAQGDMVEVNGSNYLPGEVFVNVSNTTYVVDKPSFTANANGNFSEDYFFPYALAPGTYTFTTSQNGYTGATVTASLTLVARTTHVYTDQDSYVAGETVNITGDGFSSNAPLTLVIDEPDLNFSQPVTATMNGTFASSYVLNGVRTPGTYTIIVTDDNYPTLVGKASFILAPGGQSVTESSCPSEYKCLLSPPANGIAENYACADGTSCYACPPDYQWDGATCAQETTCTPACQSGAWQCIGTQIQYCTTVNACLVWGTGQNCPDGQACVAGTGCTPSQQGNGSITSPNLTPPETQQPKPAGGFSLLLLVLLGALLVVGGTVGYLAYEGKLDFSDLAGSFRSLLHPEAKGSGSSAADPASDEELQHFIFNERAQGYDDLTIRNTLLERGWSEKDVDKVFQEVYTE